MRNQVGNIEGLSLGLCVQKRTDKRIPDMRAEEKDDHIKRCRERMRALEREYKQDGNHRLMKFLKRSKEVMGDAWPQGILTMAEEAADPIWDAMLVRTSSSRAGWDFDL